MNHNYTFLRPKDRTMAFILEYSQRFEDYMKRTNRRWTGDPLKTLDPYAPESFSYWKACDGMRKICDATNTDYGDFWRNAFEVAFGWDHPFPVPPIFFNKKGEEEPNVQFLVSIIREIEKPPVVVSRSPHYTATNYVGSVQQKAYFEELKEKLKGMGREDAWDKFVQNGSVPIELA